MSYYQNRGGPFVRGWTGGYRRLPYYDRTQNQKYYGDLIYAVGAYGNGPYDMYPPNQSLNCYLYGAGCNRCANSLLLPFGGYY